MNVLYMSFLLINISTTIDDNGEAEMIMIMIIISMCLASIMSQLFKGICTYFMFMIFNPYSLTVYSNDIGLMMIITIVMIIYDLYFYRMDALLSCWLSIISVF